MADYGLLLKNAFDEKVVSDAKTIYVDTLGTSQLNHNGTTVGQMVDAKGRIIDYAGVYGGNLHRWAATGFDDISGYSGVYPWVPSSGAQNKEDLFFWEMPTDGIVNAITYWIEPPAPDPFFPPRKASGIVPLMELGYTGLPRYCVASWQTEPDTSQDYGLRVFDANGVCSFDSRADSVIVRDFRVFTEAEIEDVLKNDASITFTPRVAPVGSPMVSLSNMFSVWKPDNNNYYYPLLEWNGTSFTVSRHRINRPDNNVRADVTQAFTMIVADAEW